MSEATTEASDNTPIGVTLKAGSGYSAPWVTVRGETAQEVEQSIDQIHDGTLLAKVAQLGSAFGKLWVEAGGEAPKPAPQQQAQAAPAASNGQPQRGDVHPTESCKDCNGQVRFVKSGVSARGPWQLWSCGNRGHEGVFPNSK